MTEAEYEILQSLTQEQFLSRAHSATGRFVSEETRLKISNKAKGRVVTEQARLNRSKAHKGKKRTEETKLKLKAARAAVEERIRLNPYSDEAKARAEMYERRGDTCQNRRRVRTPLGDFDSLKLATEAHGFTNGNPIRFKIRKKTEGYCYLD